jgi:predicted ATPase/DNA-binding SARP family transcriptional activator
MANGLRVAVLGPLEVSCRGVAVGPGGPRRRSLFALLVLRANDLCGLDAIVDGLWGPKPPASATGVVQTYVSTWRKALDDAGDPGAERIQTVGTGYRLRLADDECDLLLFRQLVEEGRRVLAEGAPSAARVPLERALALWRGPPLADLAGQPFHAEAAAALEDRRLQAVELWAEALLRTAPAADLTPVVTALEGLRREQPWRERVSELLLWALARQGRQGEALAAFAATRRALADELGIDPGPALAAMHERVLRQDPDLLDAVPAGRAPEGAVAPSRRVRLDTFVGRERELDEVEALLGSTRLVTLTGPGGAGKSRLAEEVAERVGRRTGEVAVVVELAPVDDDALVPGKIASRVGLPSAEPLDGLISLLAGRSFLFVLDNLEHLPGIGATVDALLRGTSGIRILATSRAPLGVPGEQQYGVPPLDVPDAADGDARRIAATPAVRLLLDRARSSDPRLDVTPDNADTLGRIVRMLDGLPLALEIVAPWLRPLSPDGVLEQLQHPLDIAGRGLADARHRTLRDTIAWSWDRLSPEQRDLLACVSTLRGSGDLDAITAIAGTALQRPVVDVLVDLVDRNLVQPAAPLNRRPRFRLLETVRHFAADQLEATGRTTEVADRAADHFARWAVELARHSEGPETPAWLAQAVADSDNLRAAIDRLEAMGRTEEHLQLVVDAMALWFEAGHEHEGERRLRGALARAPGSPTRPIALAYLAWLVGTHDRSEAAELARQSVDLARRHGDRPVLAFALQTLGETVDDLDGAVAASTEAGRLAGELAGDPLGPPVRYGPTAGSAVACGAAHNLAALWTYRSLPTAIEWQQRALRLAEIEGDRRITAVNSARLGLLHLVGGDPSAAAEPIARAAELMTGPVTARWEDTVTFARARLLEWQDAGSEAEAAYRDLTTSTLAGGRLLHAVLGSCALADVLIRRGALPEADAVLRRVEAVLVIGADARQRARLQVRRARLRRLRGEAADARALLDAVGTAFPDDELGPERVVWLVESALLEPAPEEARRHVRVLDNLARRTGVRIPPWEQLLLPPVPVS